MVGLGVELGAGMGWSEGIQRYVAVRGGAYCIHSPVLSPLWVSVHLILPMTLDSMGLTVSLTYR